MHLIPDYNSSKSWVAKICLSDGLLAWDCFIFVDDVQTTGNSEWESWKAGRQVGSNLQYLETSQTSGAWQGGLVHVVPRGTFQLTSEEKWGKNRMISRKWIP